MSPDDPPPGARSALVGISNVVKRFGASTVLDDVSISVAEGETVAIIGRSGSGKSTLLRCINGLEPVQGGRIRVDGVIVNDPATDLRQLRQRVGIVFQGYNLFPHLSVARNIMLAPMVVKGVSERDARAIAQDVLGRVGLAEKIDAYPGELSGGQQQRVAIARSLAMQPKLMLFDEITSALDPELTGEVLKVLEDMASSGMTMVLVTHEMGFARRFANRLLFMHNGKVWEEGPASELLAAPRTPELATFLAAVLH
jgi:polar amino acid transport system ATP-binding protein